ncbi:hypothetical protein AMECASPLE_009943 [Ameca splendens]|uniref:Uncharacterized protein n=1 Tax=Ameca splendens TaxID=208324 RepID=A0ABV0ZX99_9TELE
MQASRELRRKASEQAERRKQKKDYTDAGFFSLVMPERLTRFHGQSQKHSSCCEITGRYDCASTDCGQCLGIMETLTGWPTRSTETHSNATIEFDIMVHGAQ